MGPSSCTTSLVATAQVRLTDILLRNRVFFCLATFCALYTMSEQMEVEGLVNIYDLAKLYQIKRPGIWRHNVSRVLAALLSISHGCASRVISSFSIDVPKCCFVRRNSRTTTIPIQHRVTTADTCRINTFHRSIWTSLYRSPRTPHRRFSRYRRPRRRHPRL